jgi:hypothetical protein
MDSSLGIVVTLYLRSVGNVARHSSIDLNVVERAGIVGVTMIYIQA